MTPPRSLNSKRVALFCTSATPFEPTWIDAVCKIADDHTIITPEGWEMIKLTPIEGDFVGWTPLQLARRYVVPNFTHEDSPFASLAFVVADDESHIDGQLLVAAIHWDYFDKPGSTRVEAEGAVDLPMILHEEIHHINIYPMEDYDNEAENSATADKSTEE